MRAPEFDLIILGGGIAGAALARAMSAAGDLTLALVEARELATGGPAYAAMQSCSDFDTRVSAITPASQRFLQRLQAWDSIVHARLCPYAQMKVWDADGTGEIAFDAAEVDAPVLGHIIENRVINAALLQGLDQRPGMSLISPERLSGVAVEDGYVTISLESGDQLRAGLLVAADGALSRVRHLAQFRTREWDYGHNALVTTVETTEDHQGTALQRFLPTGPLAFLPLPGSNGRHFSSVVWSAETAVAEQLVTLDDEGFQAALCEAIEYTLGEVKACSPRVAFPLRQRHAVEYVKPGTALVGDAAHTIHPLAGQGINLGLSDVEALADVITAAHQRGEALGSLPVLRRYQRQRKGENLAMMAAMDGFKRLFGNRAPPLRWIRNRGMTWVGRSGPLKHQIMRHAMGLG
ncbi:MAG: UbiH/UbiF/VisC/COQ6 family ubiquinone biosynthesis hydroxylase [Pseudomonadota bacterium]